MRPVFVFLIALAAFAPAAVAQSAPSRDTVSGAQAVVAPERPPVRPAKPSSPFDAVVGQRPDRVSLLTEGQCTGIGGRVATVRTSTCASARKCYVVDAEGVISGRCIAVGG